MDPVVAPPAVSEAAPASKDATAEPAPPAPSSQVIELHTNTHAHVVILSALLLHGQCVSPPAAFWSSAFMPVSSLWLVMQSGLLSTACMHTVRQSDSSRLQSAAEECRYGCQCRPEESVYRPVPCLHACNCCLLTCRLLIVSGP